MTTAAPDRQTEQTRQGREGQREAPGESRSRELRIRRRELAAFLRSRRERITPEQVGLPRGPRRRTPGLRREEVAQLSAVGVTWYTWIEQARATHVSAQVLDAMARALLMDRAERAHLFALAGTADPRSEAECTVAAKSAIKIVERLAPYPASLQNARYDLLAVNRPFAQLFGDPAELPPADRNCLWLLTASERWKRDFLDRDEMLRDLIAKYRAAMAEHVAEPAWQRLLRASREFRELWDRHEVAPMSPHVKRYRHPRVGLVRLEHRNMWLAPHAPAQRVVAYVPADEESEERLERLAEPSRV
ncbi:DNA-binding protein [Streptomyces lucensis JCM 4490]|uniref:DNA-binding protein n=1 Tax=Streptomyces lucensis JCM 4490 TaxID=1306176 RepID=A0A918MMD5_9ACTN|nr:helix-turn-helix transcriptional regulator [Streptomyces lucensis]GGW38389.1 DNA-binding protein [Streptomyces lucensis JCM 4490]